MFGGVKRELDALLFGAKNAKRTQMKVGRDKGSYRNLATTARMATNTFQIRCCA